MPVGLQSVDGFCEDLAAPRPAPAGVAAAAVTARLGLSLLMKVLAITGRDTARARQLSAELARIADDDIAAVRAYMAARGDSRKALAPATIDIPLRASRAATAGLDLCAETVVERKPLAADLRAAATLLRAAHEAIIFCVEANLEN
jgi:formiminotetrahydrofolate cyclodeaminase